MVEKIIDVFLKSKGLLSGIIVTLLGCLLKEFSDNRKVKQVKRENLYRNYNQSLEHLDKFGSIAYGLLSMPTGTRHEKEEKLEGFKVNLNQEKIELECNINILKIEEQNILRKYIEDLTDLLKISPTYKTDTDARRNSPFTQENINKIKPEQDFLKR